MGSQVTAGKPFLREHGWEAKSRLEAAYGWEAKSRLGSRSYGSTDGKPSHGWEAVPTGARMGSRSYKFIL